MKPYSTLAAAVAAIESGYTEQITGDHPSQTRYSANKVRQVGPAHWWVMGHSWSVPFGGPSAAELETWEGPHIWLCHVYETPDGWMVRRWSAFYAVRLFRYDCPLDLLAGVPVNRTWRAGVVEWHHQQEQHHGRTERSESMV